MSEIKDLIKEQQQSNKRSKLWSHIATGIIGLLVAGCIGLAVYAVKEKKTADNLRNQAVELNTTLETSLEDIKEKTIALEISEENLLGEKMKLEEVQVAYDSLRQSISKEQNNLWNYTVKLNTVQGYTDYLKIRGDDGRNVVEKIIPFLTKSGYVQIQESNGNMLFEPLEHQHSSVTDTHEHDLYVSKSARSVRQGVIGRGSKEQVQRTGGVILEGQIVQIIQNDIMSGKSRWAKIKY